MTIGIKEIDLDRLKNAIENSSEVELDVGLLLASAEIINYYFIKVETPSIGLIFDEDYQLVDCFGDDVVTTKGD